MCDREQAGHGVRVLHNWLIGFLAVTIWTINHLVYFAPEIRAARHRRRDRRAFEQFAADTRTDHGFTGPLPPHERRPFPPPKPPPVHEAEIVPFPNARRPR